jgi:head-tail adaptor
MTRNESIVVKLITTTTDNAGGFTETLTKEANAPTVANIMPLGSGNSEVALRAQGDNLFEVVVNYRSDFVWTINHVVECRYGKLRVIGVRELVRRREISCACQLSAEKWQQGV